MNKRFIINASRLKIWIFSIWAMWYVFFSASLTLRPMYNILWPAVVIVVVILNVNEITKQFSSSMVNIYILYVFFLLTCAFTLLFSRDSSSSILYIQRISLAFGFSVAITAKDGAKDIIFKVMSIYSLVMLIISFIQYLIPSFYQNTLLPLVSQSNTPLVQYALNAGQSVGLTNGTSQNGLFMAIGFILFSTKAAFKRKGRFINIIIAAMFFGMTFATGKRSYSLILIGILVLILMYSMKSREVKNRPLKMMVALVAFYIIFSFAASKIPALNTIYDRFLRLSESGDVTNGRVFLYVRAWQEFTRHIVTGIGVDASLSYMGEVAHNSYLQWLLEFGFPLVLVPFITIFYIPLFKIKRINFMLKNTIDEDEKYIYTTAFLLTVMVLLSAIVATPFQWHNTFMIFMIMQMILLSMLNKYKYSTEYKE